MNAVDVMAHGFGVGYLPGLSLPGSATVQPLLLLYCTFGEEVAVHKPSLRSEVCPRLMCALTRWDLDLLQLSTENVVNVVKQSGGEQPSTLNCGRLACGLGAGSRDAGKTAFGNSPLTPTFRVGSLND